MEGEHSRIHVRRALLSRLALTPTHATTPRALVRKQDTCVRVRYRHAVSVDTGLTRIVHACPETRVQLWEEIAGRATPQDSECMLGGLQGVDGGMQQRAVCVC